MKKISIMITSYNLVDYIDESITSVIKQEMPCDWELLIGDDGSNDGTIEKLKKWHETDPEHISYYVNERPKTTVKDGYRAAKNRASLLEKASGDYLIFLDGDDCWLGIEKLKKQFAILEDQANADCSCCAHNIEAYVIPEDRRYNWIREDLLDQKFSIENYWSYYYFHTNPLLFRKECKALLLDPSYRDHLNDNLITFIVLQFGKVYYLNQVYARYNMTGDGLWTGRSKIYGLFRNITLFDLEIQIAPKLRKQTMRKHYREILQVIRVYNADDYQSIVPIMEPLNEKEFPTVFLLSKTHSLTLREIIRKTSLLLESALCMVKMKLLNIYNKIRWTLTRVNR